MKLQPISEQIRRILKKSIKDKEFSKYRIYTDARLSRLSLDGFLAGADTRISTLDKIAKQVPMAVLRVEEDGRLKDSKGSIVGKLKP